MEAQNTPRGLIRGNRYASSRDLAAMGVIVNRKKLSHTSIARMMKLVCRRVNITPRPMITDQKHADVALADAESQLNTAKRRLHTDGAHRREGIFGSRLPRQGVFNNV